MAEYGESPGETALREVRMMTILAHVHQRAEWERKFWKIVKEEFEPWQQKLLLALRRMSYGYDTGNWPMTDLPDGGEC